MVRYLGKLSVQSFRALLMVIAAEGKRAAWFVTAHALSLYIVNTQIFFREMPIYGFAKTFTCETFAVYNRKFGIPVVSRVRAEMSILRVSLVLLLLALTVHDVEAVHLPKDWLERIRQCCDAFEKNPHLPTFIPVFPPACEFVSSPAAFLMPTFMLWAPVEQYPAEYCCPKYKEMGVGLRPVG